MLASRIVTIAGLLALVSRCLAQEPAELREAREAYQKSSQTESTRSRYITKLIHMRQRFAAADNEAWPNS